MGTAIIWRRLRDGIYEGKARRGQRMEYSIIRRMYLGLPVFFLARVMPRRDVPTDLTACTVYLCDAKQFAELHALQWGGKGGRPAVIASQKRRVR